MNDDSAFIRPRFFKNIFSNKCPLIGSLNAVTGHIAFNLSVHADNEGKYDQMEMNFGPKQ